MWGAGGVGWILLTFGIDALIVLATALSAPQVSTFLKSEAKLHQHALERIHELRETGKISEQDFETLERGLEVL